MIEQAKIERNKLDNIDKYFMKYDHLSQAVEAIADHFQDKPAYCHLNYQMSFNQVISFSHDFAAYLQHDTNLKPGDRIGVQLLNSLQYPIIVYGAWKAGLIVVNMNPLYTAREMLEQCQDSQISALIFMDLFADKIDALVSQYPIPYLIQTSLPDLLPTWKRIPYQFVLRYVKKLIKPCPVPCIKLRDILKKKSAHTVECVTMQQTDIAVLQYTGGSTGKPKGVILTHGNLLSNFAQAYTVLCGRDVSGLQKLRLGKESIIAALPLYHIYAFTSHLLTCFATGSMNILISNPKDTHHVISLLKKYDFFCLIGLNTFFISLLRHPKFQTCRFDNLQYTASGGMPLMPETALKWKSVTDCDISEGYGLTECSPFVSMNPIPPGTQLNTVGLPVPETQLKLINSMTGEIVPRNQAGELCVKGPQVMQGYWRNELETKAAFDESGWFKTGDIAEILDNGYIRILERIKDIIVVSGFNVYPNEIEKVVDQHPHVLMSAVIGVSDAKTGEAIKLFVVKKLECTDDTLLSYCREHLTSYKVPKYIEFRDDLPMTPLGKVLRRKLHS
ncbi:MAG: AMP-binding protein [Endozoicomonadaceae bacterium]|nr:AMP-binding protein [Endozoicomonadaceae bacterium]